MNLKHVTIFLILLSAFIACGATAQTSSKFWITVYDYGVYKNVMGFGNDANATYAIDASLQEYEATPAPPGLDVIWVNIPGHANTWGRGLLFNDYRSLPSNSTQKDTFRLQFIISDNPDSNIYFSWPDATYLGARCDSMFFVYFDPQIPATVTINMFQQSSLMLTAPGTNSISKAFIYKYGVKTIDDVSQGSKAIPANFVLRQNYPNPFNQATQLQFSIVDLEFVTLKIYDVFGREVATLVNKEMAPGNYTQEWNAGGVASGIYFYRLQAKDFIDVKKMVLLK